MSNWAPGGNSWVSPTETSTRAATRPTTRVSRTQRQPFFCEVAMARPTARTAMTKPAITIHVVQPPELGRAAPLAPIDDVMLPMNGTGSPRLTADRTTPTNSATRNAMTAPRRLRGARASAAGARLVLRLGPLTVAGASTLGGHSEITSPSSAAAGYMPAAAISSGDTASPLAASACTWWASAGAAAARLTRRRAAGSLALAAAFVGGRLVVAPALPRVAAVLTAALGAAVGFGFGWTRAGGRAMAALRAAAAVGFGFLAAGDAARTGFAAARSGLADGRAGFATRADLAAVRAGCAAARADFAVGRAGFAAAGLRSAAWRFAAGAAFAATRGAGLAAARLTVALGAPLTVAFGGALGLAAAAAAAFGAATGCLGTDLAAGLVLGFGAAAAFLGAERGGFACAVAADRATTGDGPWPWPRRRISWGRVAGVAVARSSPPCAPGRACACCLA